MQYIKDQIQHALENQEELIRMFAAEPEEKLADRLEVIHLQSVICEQEKDLLSAEYFEIMRRIIIEARLYKWDNNIPDELTEIVQSIAETSLAIEKLEHRKKMLTKLSNPVIAPVVEQPNEKPRADNSVQLGLF